MLEAGLHRFLRTYESSVARFVVPSRFVLETLVRWGWRRESFVHVPNFVDIERFQPGNGVGRRFVYCGRLDNLKGVETLVRAAALAKQPVTIVGRGPEEARLQALAAELRADVSFAGYLGKDALPEVLLSARAVVIPSKVNENAPLSLLEAYATARPVIGSNIAGIPELIREDETGALFETGDVHALAETLERFGRLPDSRVADMGKAGRRWAEQDFNPTTYRNRLLALYASLERVAA
jgi:glycosyltransferase involved in cell wall biosynthesis